LKVSYLVSKRFFCLTAKARSFFLVEEGLSEMQWVGQAVYGMANEVFLPAMLLPSLQSMDVVFTIDRG
jgi:hypothetical protein